METNAILYFDNDGSFEDFALDPMTIATRVGDDGNETMFMQRNFSQRYHDAISSGKKFCICDVNSHVNKDGLLGTRWASYEIPEENIERYWGEDE